MIYEIIIKEQIDEDWEVLFEGMEIRLLPNGETRICGDVKDQSRLYGIISQIRDLGITLVKVEKKTTGDM